MIRTAFDRTRYPLATLMQPVDEAAVQESILQYLRLRGVYVWSVDVGGRALRGQGGPRPRTRRSAGTAGLPDLGGITRDQRMVFVEVKRPAWLSPRGTVLGPAGAPTPAQVQFLLEVAARGALACVAWGIEDVAELLDGER